MITPTEYKLIEDLAEAYRIMRAAYHHDMHREPPAMNDLQIRVRAFLDTHRKGC